MPSWTLSLFFHFSFWKDEFLHLVLILFLSRSCQKIQAGSHQTAVYFLGVNQQPNWNTDYSLPSPASPSHSGQRWARAGRLPSMTDGAGGAVRPPCYQSDLYARSVASPGAAPEPAERAAQQLFYLQPADNRVEIDRSCRQQVTPCLSAPNGSSCAYSAGQELFNSSCLSSAFTGVRWLSTTLLFIQLHTDVLPQLLADLLLIPSREHTPGAPTLLHSLYTYVCAMPGVNTEHTWTTWPTQAEEIS